MTASVIVPGLGLDGRSWTPTLEALERHGMGPADICVAPLPGYGLPGGRDGDLGPRALARVLLERLPAGGVHLLLGHSASCQVVAHASAQAPDRVSGLVLVGPTTDPRASTWPRLARRWLATARQEAAWQVPSLVREYRKTGLRTILRAMDTARHDRIDLTLREVTCPVLVVRGIHDRIAPADWAAALTSERPGPPSSGDTRAVTLPAGGHMVPRTEPVLLAPVLLEFIHRCSR